MQQSDTTRQDFLAALPSLTTSHLTKLTNHNTTVPAAKVRNTKTSTPRGSSPGMSHCRWMCRTRRFETSQSIDIYVEAPKSDETLGTTHANTQLHVSQDLSTQQRRCDKLKCRILDIKKGERALTLRTKTQNCTTDT
jgi:hypothetical protein